MAVQRENFLLALEKEIHGAFNFGEFNGVRLSECEIENEQRLVAMCDHASFNALTEANARIVPALRRAAHSEEWSAFEWMPLVVEWPKLLVVHLLRGRALFAAGVQHTLLALFLREKETAPAPHELFDLPVSRAAFTEAGIPINDSPVLNAVLMWQASLLAFNLTAIRFSSLVNLMSEQQLTEESLTASLERFSRETSEVLNTARTACESLCDLLGPIAGATTPGGAHAAEWIARVRAISGSCLFSLNPDATIRVDLDTFPPWLAEVDVRANELKEIVADIVEVFG